MKIVCISDTHGKHHQITKDLQDAEMIIHAGDISGMGYEHEIRNFLEWYSSLSYKHKILIAGNHDFFFQDYPSRAKDILAEFPNIIYLENSGITIDGIKIWGSPQQPRFFNWAFNENRGEAIRYYWKLIPKDTDILITHGPAYGYGDWVANRTHHNNYENNVGCKDLLEFIMDIQPTYHIFGHIHSGNGIYKTDGTTFVNASVLGESYMYNYSPTLIEINNAEF